MSKTSKWDDRAEQILASAAKSGATAAEAVEALALAGYTFSPPPGWPESAGWVPCDREDAALVYVPEGGTARYYRREAKP